ncbi:MAG: stage II sporulation protein M [Fuerstiella sp.]|nr:stage II sporulation protein M [Fuerstiella sp.]MCP4854944.1 stage II sporulation protein M [Fuerstiella sp.]
MSSFTGSHKHEWDELASLIQRGRKSIRRLSPNERERLDELYRRTTVHLARVTTQTRDQHLITYLNRLTAAAHSLIYLPPRHSIWRGAVRFMVEGFGRVIMRYWRLHLISAVLVIAGGMIGFFAASSDPLVAHALWPAADARQPGSTPEQLLSVLRSGRDDGGGQKFLFASFLFQHNFKVGLLAMATGVLASVPTVFLMVFNGMLMGVFVAIHYQAGIRGEMWAWILPHGVTEMGAIILCGGVGLMLGQAVVNPGIRSRRQQLLHAGREAAGVCLGVAGMLIAAAVIESYVRQSHWSTSMRLLFALGTAAFWTVYFTYGLLRERAITQSSADDDITVDFVAVDPQTG